MRVLIQHRSRYRYPRPALLGPQTIRLRPCDHARARIESYRLVVEPEHRLHWQHDPHGNHLARVTFKAGQTAQVLDLLVEMAVDINPINPFDFFVDDRARTAPFDYPDGLDAELAPFLATTDPAYALGDRGAALLGTLPKDGDSVGLLLAFNAAVNRELTYVIRDEAGVWTPEETLGHGRGSCRDLSVLLVALLRARGLAARFVSGYLVQLTDEGMIPNAPKGVSRDVVDLHAWVEAYLPGAGWIGLDATSGLMCGEGHIPLAATASPAHASPLEGTSDVASDSVEFETTIGRLGHEIRPTAPMTDETWAALLAAGDHADAALDAADLTVTTGGEPTFVARDDQMAAEWQGGALGPGKWKLGRALADRLRDDLAPGGCVLSRMGKHYPGEPLPRWALDVIGRRDGTELWPARAGREVGEIETAHEFAEHLANLLGIKAELHPAYEDPWEAVRVEARLPPEIDPRRAKLDDPPERKRLARQLDRGVGEVIAYVLPVARGEAGWITERWKLRRRHLFLVPGESPAGLRLPLDSITGAAPPEWVDAPDAEDPRRDPSPEAGKKEHVKVAPRKAPPRWHEPGCGMRTAIVVEPREGQLWVFLPPVGTFADFCELVTAIDQARAHANVAVHLEGYTSPPSPDMRRFAVTPDPGVLEVNLPPHRTAREGARDLAVVFEAALASGLTSERYMLDGRAAGSGGGNHITIGGPSTFQSPWLQRPDLIASLLAFVQHHPSLSYMFTGLFVGPTSQAPRIDEARHDALDELELALPRLHQQQPPHADGKAPAWLVDALLRNILVDVAGSTHRTEISIDKLFDPGTVFGRQGLVELRAFEMPPHPRMAAAQLVLVRALLAAFTKKPYVHALVRWGRELHDRFLLPYWMWRDFEDVLAYLREAGQPLPPAAFAPFVELRCPLVGSIPVHGGDGVVELRNAVEPWHVLGEEVTAAGTARYVDSSLERLELRAVGVDEERYVIAVNQIALPLRSTARRELRVGGVRFRAWCPPHALQPHLGIHHPIRIDVVDTWAQRGVGAGVYHVWHPEGRAFDAAPLTRVEAAARRAQRFTLQGAAGWPLHAREVDRHAAQTYTLDLRRYDLGHPMPRAEDWIIP